MKEDDLIYNSFLERELPIYKEELENGIFELSTRIITDNRYYILYGIMDIKEFKKVISNIKPFEGE